MNRPSPTRHPTLTHWGAYHIEVADGEIAAVHPHRHDPHPSPIGQSFRDRFRHHSRVAQPMVRQG